MLFFKKVVANRKGFSLAELMVSLGLIGIVSLGVMQLMKRVEKGKKQADQIADVKSISNHLKRIIIKSQKNINWQLYNFNQSYFMNASSSGKPSLVTWNLASLVNYSSINQLSFTLSGKQLFRSSNLLEIPDIVNGAKTIFSRCIPNSSIDKSFSYAEALALTRIPIVNLTSNNKLKVFCCPLGSSSTCTSELINKNSGFQLRTFYKTKNSFITFPSSGDKRLVKGAGFFLSFNKPTNPNQFLITIFVQYDRCIQAIRDDDAKGCKSNYLIEFQSIVDQVFQSGMQERGFMDVI